MLSAKEASFYASSKEQGFDDATIAGEIKKRREAKPTVEAYRPTDYAPKVESGPSTDVNVAATQKAKTPDELKAESAGRLEGGTGTHEDRQAVFGSATPGAIEGTPEGQAQDFAKFAAGGLGGMAAGNVLGKALETAPGRVATRWLDETARGAGKAARDGLGVIRDKTLEFVKGNPDLMKAKNPKDLLEQIKTMEAAAGTARDIPLDKADEIVTPKAARDPAAPVREVSPFDEVSKMEYPQAERAALESDLAKRGIELPRQPHETVGGETKTGKLFAEGGKGGVVQGANMVSDVIRRTPEQILADVIAGKRHAPRSFGAGPSARDFDKARQAGISEKNAATPFYEKPKTGRLFAEGSKGGAAPAANMISKGGANPNAVIDRYTATIDRLNAGSTEEREIAKAAEGLRAKFAEAYGENPIPSKALRKEATALQNKGYRKEATTPEQKAAAELSKDTLDSLREHVTDPKLMKEIDDLTADLHVLKNLETVAESKKLNADSFGKPIKEKPGVIKSTLALPGKAIGATGRGADQILARLARAGATGEDVSEIVTGALRLGITQEQIDETLQSVEKVKQRGK